MTARRKITIRQYKQGDGDFWQRMGPWLVNKDVHKEFGGPIASPPETTWWLAIDQEDRTVGFAAVQVSGWHARLRYGYAASPDLYRRLLEERLAACRDAKVKVVRATVREHNLQHYLGRGFRVTSRTGQFVKVELRLVEKTEGSGDT